MSDEKVHYLVPEDLNSDEIMEIIEDLEKILTQ
jgi:hypothetical protein